MSDDLKSAIRALIKTPGNIPGLISISVIDRRGVPFFEEFAESREHDRTLKNCYRFTSIGSWEQRPAIKRLNQGENKYTIAFYKNNQLIQVNKYPLTVVFFATELANTGLILKHAEELGPYFDQAAENAKTNDQE